MGILDGVTLIDDLSFEDRNELALFCQAKTLRAGEQLFLEWDEANAMYILKTGELLVSKNIWGKEVILWSVFAEEVIGEMALFGEKTKRMATAVAVKDSELITMLSFSITQLAEKNPDLMQKIVSIIETRNEKNKELEVSIKK